MQAQQRAGLVKNTLVGIFIPKIHFKSLGRTEIKRTEYKHRLLVKSRLGLDNFPKIC